MDSDVALVSRFWERLDAGRLEDALSVIGESGPWQPLAGDRVFDGREGMARYLSEIRARGGDFSGHAYAVRRSGDRVIVRGVVRYSGPDGFSEAQGHWVHRVEDGVVTECVGVATERDAVAFCTA